MRPRLLLLPGLLAVILASPWLRAEPGDVEGSHDYSGFPRLPGFVITDYDEDNPSDFNFPVARPLPIDANHVETVLVKGHRYIIRYEPGPGAQGPSLLQAQLYYEKLAAAAGFTVEKTGAVGDVTETFHRAREGHDVWVYLEPSMTVNVLTVVESKGAVPLPPAMAAHPPANAPTAEPPPPVPAEADEPLYTALIASGRIVLPLTFLPGKPDLDANSQPVIDRVAAMLKLHPELRLEIEGHTDNTGDPDYNLLLSKQRAMTVRGMLIAAHIAKIRLTAVGMGGSQPVANDKTTEGREKNRRIELVLPKETSPARKDSTSFHSPAPDGVNYYPGDDASSSPASSAGHSAR